VGLKSGTYHEEEIPKPNIFTHCSVLIRLSPDGKQLFSSHDTWYFYNTMLRIYKTYRLNFNLPSNASPLVAFASYPGIIQSTDDFYITQQKLYVAETSNDIFNNSLYMDYMSPKTVPEWVRVILANRMATSGEEWSSYFSLYNSGTYNNQWQVVDYKLFTPGQPLPKGTLWVLEQVPGFCGGGGFNLAIKSTRVFPFL